MTSKFDNSVTSKAIWAIRIAFISNGLAMGSVYVRIPDLKQKLMIDNLQIGTILLCASIGVLIAISQAGRICAKSGSRPVAIYSSYAAVLSLLSVSLSQTYLLTCLTFAFWGFTAATQDVAMNTHASTLEHQHNKRYMSGFHATFSLGALFGSLIGGIASQNQISLVSQSLIIGSLFIFFTSISINWWLPADADRHNIEDQKKLDKRPKIFLFIGLLGFASTINEGASGDWGGILARETFNATPFLSALPYIFFNVAMVIGRFSGDWLATKFGAIKILFTAGLMSGIGLAGGLIIGNIYGQIFGWFAIGAGMSVVIPMVFSLAAEIARERYPGQIAPSQAVAVASGISYVGFMVGPPMMGFIAEVTTLRWAMLIPAALAIALAFGSRTIKR